MFNNLERLVEAHRILDDRLQNVCMSNDPLWAHVLADHVSICLVLTGVAGLILTQLERNLQQYVAYFAGYEHGSALARSYSKNSKQFEDWADNVKYQTSNMPDCRNSDLLALLAELVQRVPRYKYMLKGKPKFFFTASCAKLRSCIQICCLSCRKTTQTYPTFTRSISW